MNAQGNEEEEEKMLDLIIQLHDSSDHGGIPLILAIIMEVSKKNPLTIDKRNDFRVEAT